jgi:hypothetical protein
LGRKKEERPACLACGVATRPPWLEPCDAGRVAGREKGDARILGSGNFVENILTESDKIEGYKFVRKVSLPELVGKISSYLDTDKNEVLCGNRKEKNCQARALISFAAGKNMGIASTILLKYWAFTP